MLSAADRRRPWLLLAPSLITLFVLMILPIGIMTIFSFYEFVTAGVEKQVFITQNWHDFLTDSFYHMFLWKTVRVAAITAILCALMGYPAAYCIAMTTYKHKWLLLLLLIVPFWISFIIRTLSWIHILGEQDRKSVV